MIIFPSMQMIDSPLDPRLSDYRLLKSKEELTDYFIADNEKTAIRLLNSDLRIKSVFCLPRYFERHKDLILSKLADVNSCYVAEKDIFEQTIGFSVHQGFMAIGYKAWSPLQYLDSSQILFNRIADSENVGSMIRTSVAMGVRTLVFDPYSAPPFLRRSVRVSMGSIFSAKITQIDLSEKYLEEGKENGYTILALSLPRENSELLAKTKSIYDFKKVEKFILIVGNEATGIDLNLLSLADQIFYIPMKNEIDSLNVSHALAVALSAKLR